MTQQRRIGNYTLEKPLGQGQFGTVFLASSLVKEQQNLKFAVKVISKARINTQQFQRIDQEKNNQAIISYHPHIAMFYEFIVSTNSYYIVMEYCNYGDLRGFQKQQNNKIPENLSQQFAFQILSGIYYLKENGIMHRDLKPENILLHKFQGELLIKLADLGLSRKLKKHELAETMCGTPLYAAPEVLQQEKYDYKSDLWSFGVLIYEILAGQLPFTANSIKQLLQAFQKQLP